jgi:gluconolactonase
MINAVKYFRIEELIQPGESIEPLVSGFDFTEGPVWHPVEKSLVFSDILGNSIYRWSEAAGLQTLRRNSYMANGNAYDQQGRILTCEHATSRLTRTDFANDGDLEVLATHYQGKQLNSPNDVVVKTDGTIYFTDPTSGRSAGYGIPREPELPFSGVYRLDPETNILTLLVDDFAKPNGLCFAPDEQQLYINDTVRQHIRVFDVTPEGLLVNGRLFATLEGDAPGVADGMKVDSAGHVYSCGPGGIHIFAPDGRCLGVVATPEFATNFVFGDDDLRTLYITATTSLYRLRVQVPGHNTFTRGSYV